MPWNLFKWICTSGFSSRRKWLKVQKRKRSDKFIGVLRWLSELGKVFFCVWNEIICQCFCKRLAKLADESGKTNIFQLNVGNHAWCACIFGHRESNHKLQFHYEFERVAMYEERWQLTVVEFAFWEPEFLYFFVSVRGGVSMIKSTSLFHGYPLSMMTYYTHIRSKLLYIE